MNNQVITDTDRGDTDFLVRPSAKSVCWMLEVKFSVKHDFRRISYSLTARTTNIKEYDK